jgi:hypothetical protein
MGVDTGTLSRCAFARTTSGLAPSRKSVLARMQTIDNHANVRLPLGRLEAILITPRLHRLHHTPATTERNLGTILTLWDRLRGTLVTGNAEPRVFGLPGESEPYPEGWWRQLVEPGRRVTRQAASAALAPRWRRYISAAQRRGRAASVARQLATRDGIEGIG